ncbi:hypothetical protein IMSHALPRED_009125 [Imshaugia aleurites]|uniref:Uncharacterized protein n=1 Tax=Imshaugia aleurites TaxID=172621 RepID=A0A8H3IY28_9LECA|nr:hypothetical protein IMSHALPRED_009125 [Imshaugia aleurites]
MFNNAAKPDRWGNTAPEPPAQTVHPPSEAGLPPVPPPPPYGSPSDYPPPPSFPLELPPPSPTSTPTGGSFGFSTTGRVELPADSSPPPGLSSIPPIGGASPTRHVPILTSTTAAQNRSLRPSDPEKRCTVPSFTRPICNTCHANCVSVREGNINFCERCFQDALKRRGKKESSKANRPKCKICHVNSINVRDGEMIYCERCWQESLRKRGVRDDGSVWA